jgi:hypothetical protein
MTDVVETLRGEIRAMKFERIGDAEVARLRQLNAEAVQNDLIEGIVQSEQDGRFWEMLLEERVPQAVSEQVVARYNKLTLG